jgi:hypothetical protein
MYSELILDPVASIHRRGLDVDGPKATIYRARVAACDECGTGVKTTTTDMTKYNRVQYNADSLIMTR